MLGSTAARTVAAAATCTKLTAALAGRRFAVRSYYQKKATTGATGRNRASRISGSTGQQGGTGGAHRAQEVMPPSVEVEVKLRLPGPEAHQQLEQLLEADRVAVHQQENYFFDGPARELNSRLVVLRLRFYDTDKKAVLTLKGQQILQDGIGRASEVEEELDAAQARKLLDSPSDLLKLPSELMRNLASTYSLTQLVCLGGFKNTRQEVSWQGYTLELDETSYPWGTLYELEAESDKPEELKAHLESMLQQQGIPYSYSTTSKFANFINKTLL